MAEAETIRAWLESMVDVPDTWDVTEHGVSVPLGTASTRLTLTRRAIDTLRRRTLPRIAGMTLVPHCGIEVHGFAEYLISLDALGSWAVEAPLRFKVGKVGIRLGRISPLLALLCESAYRYSDFSQKDFFESYSTLQIEDSTRPQDDAIIALFYINSDYLRPLSTSARIHHLVDPSDPIEIPSIDPADKVVRQRVRVRKSVSTLPAVLLFNEATGEASDARFLGFYRVLEFFFRRGAVLEFGRIRRDATVSDAELLSSSRLKDESAQLRALMRATLTASERRKVTTYVNRHGVPNARGIDDVANALYSFRNTLVHAKEAEIDRTRLPRPFTPDAGHGPWTWVAEMMAERAIRRLS